MAVTLSELPNGSALRSRSKPGDHGANGITVTNHAVTEDAVQGEDPSKVRKTFGRTPDKVFVVPQTHDMVSTLLSPTQPKNLSDLVILAVLGIHIALLVLLPEALRTPVIGCLFVVWRTSYNFGIGYLLRNQSNHKRLVWWARKSGIFDAKLHPRIAALVKYEIETKIPDEVKNGDYVFEDAPVEYNTWLVFRRIVDLVLMCDFVSYVLFAISCAHVPVGEGWGLTCGRWIGGVVLFMFNLWVKLDAHRVVKDYAWYWGDFFFLIDQNLTFDGVFEMAPHPMYSVGYAGYYGISLISASYTVLFVSLAAHAAQFVFLTVVENPHIDKTYNPPVPRRKTASLSPRPLSPEGQEPYPAYVLDDCTNIVKERKLLGKFDLFYNTHMFTALIVSYLVALALLTPNTPAIRVGFLIHAVGWRIWHTVGMGLILVRQSRNKAWFRHFLKFGQTREEAWGQWKGLYHMSLAMCHASFISAGWKCYHFPAGEEGMVLFRHTLGIMLIALQIWTAASIYESLGEFGWFFGDFFFEKPTPGLTYSGIYRYVNNPERLIGCAGIWGIVLITSSSDIFMLGLFSHVCLLLFIHLVERPHMEKLYGNQIRKEAGMVKTIKKAIPPPVAHSVSNFQGSIDKALADVGEFVEEFLESATPRLTNGVMGVVKETRLLISRYPARLSLTFLADDLADYDLKKYSITILNAVREIKDGGVAASLSVPFGEPIRIAWTAPVNHSRLDWIGLYRIADNDSREATKIASMGRWTAICKDEYDTDTAETGVIIPETRSVFSENPKEEIYRGEIEFAGDKTFWANGVYEFRYHHDGKHNVMAISLPFEIVIGKAQLAADDTEEEHILDMQAMQESVEKTLLPVVVRCFESDEDLAPNTVDEEFGGFGEKYAKRIVYAVKELFGVDFAPEVVQADGNVRRLAWRICNAKRVLVPAEYWHEGYE